jgi:acyl-CoA synthetase (AMP-forming)/AMP-acid ligase II
MQRVYRAGNRAVKLRCFFTRRTVCKRSTVITASTLGNLLRSAAFQAPDTEAFRYRSERLTYDQWDRLADHVAASLSHLGIGHGDVVALLLPSTPLYLVAYLGAARLGAVTTGINTRFRRQEIGYVLHQSGARALLAVDEWHQADFRSLITSLRPELPELGEVRWVSAKDITADTQRSIEMLMPRGAGERLCEVRPDDPAAIVFTSGTTGVPKGAWYSHRNLLALAEIDTRRYAGGVIPFRKHLAAGLSFAHIGTMARIAVQISHLGTSILHDAFDPAAVLEVIERERLTHLGGIPTQIIMLMEHPDRRRRDLTSLQSILLGGAPASPALIRRIQETFNASISVRYSSTEVGIATASLPHDPPEILATTVGKATSGVELQIVDAANRPAPVGEVGEVVVRSPACMRGYWRAPEATAKTIDEQGWIHTGDLGYLDEQGYLRLKGRQSEMYIRGGYNVFPEEVENLLVKHPQVARAAVIGVPDEVFGEIGWAFVVPRDTTSLPSLEEIRAFVGAELASFKRPDGMTIVGELPVTPMFKVDKRALRDLQR